MTTPRRSLTARSLRKPVNRRPPRATEISSRESLAWNLNRLLRRLIPMGVLFSLRVSIRPPTGARRPLLNQRRRRGSGADYLVAETTRRTIIRRISLRPPVQAIGRRSKESPHGSLQLARQYHPARHSLPALCSAISRRSSLHVPAGSRSHARSSTSRECIRSGTGAEG